MTKYVTVELGSSELLYLATVWYSKVPILLQCFNQILYIAWEMFAKIHYSDLSWADNSRSAMAWVAFIVHNINL